MTRCKIWLTDQKTPLIVNAAAETVAAQITDASAYPLVPMLADEFPDEIDRGGEFTVYVAPRHVTLVTPIVEDD